MTDADWTRLFAGMAGIISILMSLIGAWIGKSFEKLVASIEELNVNVAVVVEKVNSHEKRIDHLEKGKKHGS